MAKKVSKRSRAARRLEYEEPEIKDLAKIERAEKTDIASAIIRATVKKNETLLHDKQIKKENKNHITKKNKLAQNSNISKEKLQRAINLSDRLEGKIIKSKQRSKFVQTTRKSNWDSINATLKTESSKSEETTNEPKEDAMEDEKFYTDSESEDEKQQNAFALLGDEVEA